MIIKSLKPEEIRRDGDTQPRTRLNQATIEEYVEAIQNGDKLPPVEVYHDGETYWLADGFHRYCALTKLDPDGLIESRVHEGTLQDAQWHSYGANKTHGLRRTNEDKAQAVKRALVHPKSSGMSDAALADHVGVHRNTVLKVRREMSADASHLHKMCKSETESSGNGSTAQQATTDPSTTMRQPEVRPRTGRDGRTINTAKIGRRTPRSPKPRRGNVPDRNAYKPRLGHSRPCPMIPLSLPLNNPTVAAATLWQEFPVSFIEALVELLNQRLQQPEGAQS